MITQLPVVILLKILSYLSVADLTKTALVSKQFLGLCKLILRPRNGLLDLSSTWQRTVENNAVIPSNALQAARVFEKVSLRYCTKHSFRFLLNFKALRVLGLLGQTSDITNYLHCQSGFIFLPSTSVSVKNWPRMGYAVFSKSNLIAWGRLALPQGALHGLHFMLSTMRWAYFLVVKSYWCYCDQ